MSSAADPPDGETLSEMGDAVVHTTRNIQGGKERKGAHGREECRLT